MGKGTSLQEHKSEPIVHNYKRLLVLIPTQKFPEISLEIELSMFAFCCPGLQPFVLTLYDELSSNINIM